MNAVYHVAGRANEGVTFAPCADRTQRCAQCGVVLRDWRRRGFDFPSDAPGPLSDRWPRQLAPYPEGAIVEVTAHSQSMALTCGITPTCAPRRPSPAAVDD